MINSSNGNSLLAGLGSSDAGVYTDLSGLQKIKQVNKQGGGEEALQAIAKQFESVFLNMMMKSMREANEAFKDEGMSGSNEMDFYQQMFDQQLALSLSSRGGMGLADALVRQMRQSMPGGQPAPQPSPVSTPMSQLTPVSQLGPVPQRSSAPLQSYREVAASDSPAASTAASPFVDQQDFIQRLTPLAATAANEIGVDPRYLISQAALETGWGQHLIVDDAGRNSHNLFGIKAGADWPGRVAVVETLEYRDGLPVTETARFRAYDSYAESFRDYASFVGAKQRYQEALNSAPDSEQYLHELQRAGYATDPDYASKIIDIVRRNFTAAATAERG
ncbi:flagellar assembly peptidoglycan hydrolase FlgJ [Pseudomaricurvus alcaniphilus]|uniref:flagellar assembly peptidoglycan hydrolase FlgJ n=1 Tax=Pseudomaricurvus alcaniphilus TaxID=1166482 RepID=UPI00140B9D73|nr:flagellar assembly peptidoglycan hydrolase FlgJ [Pseudomaricurvus alcaniphilus]NHN39453.1 flagellar assembly peptidoglycan hydrolase FlgJ [Pseudomaricurvus alcaniphilus]